MLPLVDVAERRHAAMTAKPYGAMGIGRRVLNIEGLAPAAIEAVTERRLAELGQKGSAKTPEALVSAEAVTRGAELAEDLARRIGELKAALEHAHHSTRASAADVDRAIRELGALRTAALGVRDEIVCASRGTEGAHLAPAHDPCTHDASAEELEFVGLLAAAWRRADAQERHVLEAWAEALLMLLVERGIKPGDPRFTAELSKLIAELSEQTRPDVYDVRRRRPSE